MNECDIVILYSGGADSRLMIEIALQSGKRPYCILVDYGQKHIEEIQYGIKQLKDLNIAFQIVTIEGLGFDSGLTGSLDEGRWENVHAMNVPARNSWFLTLAAGVAESMNIQEIWIGCDMSDYYGEFPDCKQEYIGRINKLFEIAFTKPISVEAPLLGMKKELIMDILKIQYGINSSEVYSGYEPPVDEEIVNKEDDK